MRHDTNSLVRVLKEIDNYKDPVVARFLEGKVGESVHRLHVIYAVEDYQRA